MIIADTQKNTHSRWRSIRAVILGFLLVPLNIYFLMYMEVGFNQGSAGTGAGPYPSTLSLFANCIFFLTILTVLNAGTARVVPRASLSRSELLIVYVMLTIATAIVSIDFMDVLVPMMTYPFRAANNVNQYRTILWPHLPHWACVRDPAAVRNWYEGNSSLYLVQNWRPWVIPVAAWSACILTMLWVMFCINALVCKRWIEHDRLQFPIVELPLQMTEPGHRLLKSRLMWIGFGIAGGISFVNGLHGYYPLVPSIPTRMWDAAPMFANKPWNAVGWTPVSLYPYAIGLGFLLPLDMLFSCWFFYLAWKVVRILGSVYGAYDANPEFPYMNQQALGAYYLVGLFALWTGRRYFREMVAEIISSFSRRSGTTSPSDGQEPIPLRIAFIGMIAGTAALVGFFSAIGLGWWLAIAGVLLYFFLAFAVARMHAEFGPPAHDLHIMGPEVVLTGALGTTAFSPGQLAGLSWFWWFNRAYRSIPIAYQLDGLKIAQRSQTPYRVMSAAIAVASVTAVVSGFWFYLHLGYLKGAEVGMAGHVPVFGLEAWQRHFETWTLAPAKPNLPATFAIGWGMVVAYALYILKLNVPWWPLHPLGFAVSTSYSIGTLWLPLMIAWAAKIITVRTGGLRAYRTVLDFFLGLLLGDFIVGCLWPLYGLIRGVPTYSFMQ